MIHKETLISRMLHQLEVIKKAHPTLNTVKQEGT
jgi:hypothetical protein